MTLAAAGCGQGADGQSTQAAHQAVTVGLAYDLGGRGDKSFNDAAAAGLERAKTSLDVQIKELEALQEENDEARYGRLKLLCDAGYQAVIAVGFVYAGSDPAQGPLARASRDCPNTKFAAVDVDTVHAPNLTNLVFADDQGSFLMGAAAALKSKSGRVGFVGGCDLPLIKRFEVGYRAGAKAVRADTAVDVRYLSTPAQACSGFINPNAGQAAAARMYAGGADVVYHAAGGSGLGVFKAAKASGKWAVGVDSDQYQLVAPELRDVILTSMIKRVDTAVFEFIRSVGEGRFTPGTVTFGLQTKGVEYATSGGKVDDIKSQLEGLKQQLSEGKIVIPAAPAG
ncbi:basic membrane protein A [Krasilnikovia cinnamomea]|uniref:Basic membrane protein A n=1 Tax=Krasilnikovia cinnamomea TaxID=349313 RepID=A0A4V2G7I2_9ACTN|nr:BMP family ABC transporter substrate-binding protein [Krasilnikovia cinnamomea]RZU52706.1 basic membrane protein A [Krasilnikovia cinnamomea]